MHFFRAVVAAGLGPGEREKNGSASVMPGRRKRERKLRRAGKCSERHAL